MQTDKQAHLACFSLRKLRSDNFQQLRRPLPPCIDLTFQLPRLKSWRAPLLINGAVHYFFCFFDAVPQNCLGQVGQTKIQNQHEKPNKMASHELGV